METCPSITISSGAHERAPLLAAFSFVVSGLAGADRAVIASAIADAARAKLNQLDLDRLREEGAISAWREVYRSMGLRPSDFRSSVEQLVRRALRGGLPSGAGLVDLYNRASIASVAPLGGYDLAAINGDIVVRPLDQSDDFDPIGGDASRFPLADRVLGYTIGGEVICWALNCRDSARTALMQETERALFVSEAIDGDGAAASQQALTMLRDALIEAGAACGPIMRAAIDG